MLAEAQNAHILTGPTGSGKTRLGVELAVRLHAEIICMDSMTLYRGMDVGTAKPGPAERARVLHHLIDVLDPWESASVAWWLDQAAHCCRDIESRGKSVLFVGGTPLYLKALLFGLFDGPARDPALREQLEAEARSAGAPALHARLAAVDAVTADRLHPHDLRRVIRALEVWQLTGRPMSAWQTEWPGRGPTSAPPAPETERCRWLDLPRSELHARIDARVVQMVQDGFATEVRALRQLPRPLSREAAQALGYREMAAFLDGQLSLDETIRRIQTRTRQFAKRQRTWFRHLPGCRPVGKDLTFAS